MPIRPTTMIAIAEIGATRPFASRTSVPLLHRSMKMMATNAQSTSLRSSQNRSPIDIRDDSYPVERFRAR